MQLREEGTYASAGTALRLRVRSPAGRTTTAHVARYPREQFTLRLTRLEPPRPVLDWARGAGIGEALNGGFFSKPDFTPLGDLRVDGQPMRSVAFSGGWGSVRGTISIDGDHVAIGPRDELPPPSASGSLLVAGPLLVRDGRPVVAERDPEGFSTTCGDFDSDITDGPYPRCAIGTSADELLAVVVDGRSDADDGLTLVELAGLLAELGAGQALNLDGGSSAALVTDGHMRNVPRDNEGDELVGGYPTPSAFAFVPR